MESNWSESNSSAAADDDDDDDDDEVVRPKLMSNHSEDDHDKTEHVMMTGRSELSQRVSDFSIDCASDFSIDSLLSDLPRQLHSTTTHSGKIVIVHFFLSVIL